MVEYQKMPKKTKKTEESRFIPGIYQYCDRWCKRCLFTSRCLNYALLQQDDGEHSKALKEIEDYYKLTVELLARAAEKREIEIHDLFQRVSNEEHRPEDGVAVFKLAKLAKDYITMVSDFVDKMTNWFSEVGDDLMHSFELGIKNQDEIKTAIFELREAVDHIRWYYHEIYIKLGRALLRLDKEDEYDKDGKKLQRDSDGAAKVALMAIEQSKDAWLILQKHFSRQSDSFLDILAQLDRLRKNTEKVFPKASSFIRPGFDTGDSPIYEES